MSSNYSHTENDSSSSSTSSTASSPDSSPGHISSQYGDDNQFVPPQPMKNVFANDGSFLEMFKKYQQKEESCKKSTETNLTSSSIESSTGSKSSSSSVKPVVIPMIGKRRGGKILPTGKVKKLKTEDDDEDANKQKDAWSVYMSEVKKYKETVCQTDDKTRPLVK